MHQLVNTNIYIKMHGATIKIKILAFNFSVLSVTEFATYRMIREERSVFWEVTESIIIKKNHMAMCPIPNG